MAKFEKILTDHESGEQAFIKSNDYFLFQQKIEKQLEKWAVKNTKARGVEKAQILTEEAQQEQKDYANVLKSTLNVDDKIDWESLKDKTCFHQYIPQKPVGKELFFVEVPQASWIERIIPYLKDRRFRKENEANEKYSAYVAKFSAEEESRRSVYNAEKEQFEENQKRHNLSILKLQTDYETGIPQGIETYLNMVLENSKYPDTIQIEHTLEYVAGSMVLKIETFLPNIDELNFLSTAKYIPSRDEIQLKQLTKSEVKTLYTDLLNQIVLRTIHEIFEAEHLGHVQRVEMLAVNNGIDSTTGKDSTFTYCKLGIERDCFMKIDLSRINPEACLLGLGTTFGKETNFLKRKAA